MGRNVGDITEITLSLTHPDTGAPVDPFSLSLQVTDPAGDSTTYEWNVDGEISRVQVGVFRGAFLLASAGTWAYRWQFDGDVVGAEDGEVWAQPSSYSVGGMVPTIRDVARLLPQRTFVGGRKLDTFTDETNPTAAQAGDAIATATTLIRGAVGTVEEDRAGEQWEAVRKLIGALTALRAALLLATTSDPEYDRLSKEYDRMKPEVVKALQDAVAGDPVGVGEDRAATAPQWSFPCAGTTLDERY